MVTNHVNMDLFGKGARNTNWLFRSFEAEFAAKPHQIHQADSSYQSHHHTVPLTGSDQSENARSVSLNQEIRLHGKKIEVRHSAITPVPLRHALSVLFSLC